MRIDGYHIAERILERLKRLPRPRAKFSAVLVGNDPSSRSFLERKAEVARELGIRFDLHAFPASANAVRVRAAVRRLSRSASVGGVVVQLPLPPHLSRQPILDAVAREKDVDCLSTSALGALATGMAGVMPPAVGTVEEILRTVPLPSRPLRAAVVGSGPLVGKPLSLWLWFQRQIADLTIFRSEARSLRRRLRDYDLIVSGAGQAGLFSAGDLKRGAVVIDFGYARRAGRMCGDFTPPRTAAEERRVTYTPAPGGAGPVLVAKLFENFYKLNSRM